MLWAPSPLSQDAWGHGRQTLNAVEKLPQKSVTNKERKRKELCLPLNEAKNGKRVWCRSGTQPAFSKWGRLNFPTSSQLKTTFKTTYPPHTPPLQRDLFHPLTWKTEKDCILPASLSCSFSEIIWTIGKDEERWGWGAGGKLPTVPFDCGYLTPD